MKRASWCGFFAFVVTASVVTIGGCGGKVEAACDPRAQSCVSIGGGGDAGASVTCDDALACSGGGLAMQRCRTLDSNGICKKATYSLSDGRTFPCASCSNCALAASNASEACSTAPPPDPLDASPPPPPPPPFDGGVTPACSPKDESGFAWKAHPPLRSAGACSPEQLKAYHQCLVDQQTASNPASCAAFNDPANKACTSCLVTPDSAAFYGPLIAHAKLIELNIPGCFSLVATNPADKACGDILQADTACREDACSACLVTDQPSFDDEQACEQAADEGGCAGYAAKAKCSDAIPNASVCRTGTDFIEFFDTIAPLFCE